MTARVKRILAASAILSALPIAAVWAADAPIPVIGAAGLAVWLLAPLWLVMGNWLLTPLDAVAKAGDSCGGRQLCSRRPSPKSSASPAVMARRPPRLSCATSSACAIRSMPRPRVTTRSWAFRWPSTANWSDDYRTEIFISEMGAYVEGEIARICQLTPPDIAIITEVGPQHLERFGSLENVQKAKYELVANLPPGGVAAFSTGITPIFAICTSAAIPPRA